MQPLICRHGQYESRLADELGIEHDLIMSVSSESRMTGHRPMKRDLPQALALYREKGRLQYSGEPVSQLDHAWQSFRLAARAGASSALQLAAFFHDLGHLFQREHGSPTLSGKDDKHEDVGAAYLRAFLPDAVCEPIALHVAAKRYLVATEPEYAAKLSEDSVRSLALQGGPMSAREIAEFETNPWSQDAVALRRWDEEAKSGSAHTPDIERVLSVVSDLARDLPASTQSA